MSSLLPGRNNQNQNQQAMNKAFKNDLPPKSHSWVFLLFVLIIGVAGVFFLSDPVKVPVDQKTKKETNRRNYMEKLIKEREEREKAFRDLDPFSNPEAVSEEIANTIAPGYVRVAAAQFYSRLDETDLNLKRMKKFIEKAAEKSVQVIVFPEANTCGYADLNKWNLWATDPKAAAIIDDTVLFHLVKPAAQPSNGKTFQFISELAKKHKIIIAYGYIEESDDGKYYSSLQLVDENGKALENYRKKRLWETTDPYWATPSLDLTWTPVDTKVGKIGLLISYDFKPGIKELSKGDVDIILHSCAFFGNNLLPYFANGEYITLVQKSGASIVMANWANMYVSDWAGYGLSRVIAPGGLIVAARGSSPKEFLVISDLPVERARKHRQYNRLHPNEEANTQESPGTTNSSEE